MAMSGVIHQQPLHLVDRTRTHVNVLNDCSRIQSQSPSSSSSDIIVTDFADSHGGGVKVIECEGKGKELSSQHKSRSRHRHCDSSNNSISSVMDFDDCSFNSDHSNINNHTTKQLSVRWAEPSALTKTHVIPQINTDDKSALFYTVADMQSFRREYRMALQAKKILNNRQDQQQPQQSSNTNNSTSCSTSTTTSHKYNITFNTNTRNGLFYNPMSNLVTEITGYFAGILSDTSSSSSSNCCTTTASSSCGSASCCSNAATTTVVDTATENAHLIETLYLF